jgi:short-subunit dehydrogenase involved in D-alanine esterification of teichoic acids
MYKNILITGGSTKISFYLKKLISKKYNIYSPSKKSWDLSNPDFDKDKINLIKKCDKIYLFHSILSNKIHLSKNYKEIHNQLNINLLSTINICEIALSNNKNVQIFILGSESGLKGSYDIIYSLTKSSIHKYVEERKIFYKNQQLVCIAPSTIIDGKMTIARKDKSNVRKSISNNPKKRGLYSKEISKLLYDLSFNNTKYLSNTVIHVNGGKFSRM